MRNLCSIVILHTQLWMHFAKTNRKTTKKKKTLQTNDINSVRRTDYFFLQPRETLLL